jgi:acyl carrier protein
MDMVREALETIVGPLNNTASLIDQLSSLQTIQFFHEVEEKFGMSIDLDVIEASDLLSVEAFVGVLTKLAKERCE